MTQHRDFSPSLQVSPELKLRKSMTSKSSENICCDTSILCWWLKLFLAPPPRGALTAWWNQELFLWSVTRRRPRKMANYIATHQRWLGNKLFPDWARPYLLDLSRHLCLYPSKISTHGAEHHLRPQCRNSTSKSLKNCFPSPIFSHL